MASPIEQSDAVKNQQEKDVWTAKNTKPEDVKQLDQINYDFAPLEGPVIYLTHKVSN